MRLTARIMSPGSIRPSASTAPLKNKEIKNKTNEKEDLDREKEPSYIRGTLNSCFCCAQCQLKLSSKLLSSPALHENR